MTIEKDNIVLHVADVHKTFGGLHALSDIDLQIEEGKTHAIIGPNGAGKSTLLNVVVGRLAPTRGAVVFDGQVLTGKQPHEINQVGVARVFQTPEIFPDLTVIQNVMAPAFARRDGSFTLNFFKSIDDETEIREEAADLAPTINAELLAEIEADDRLAGGEDSEEDTAAVADTPKPAVNAELLAEIEADDRLSGEMPDVEEQTEKLMDVCRLRDTPIVTFMNKFDRESLDALELIDNVEKKLSIQFKKLL